MLPTVWFKPGLLIIYGAALDASIHQHHAIQLVWPTGQSECQYEGGELAGPVIINTQVKHQLQMDAGWILLVEPQSLLGKQLLAQLNQQAVMTIPHLTNAPSLASISTTQLSSKNKAGQPQLSDIAFALFAPLFSLDDNAAQTANVIVSDKRIQQVLTTLDLCLNTECQKPANLRAASIAKDIALSESRFLHLFSQQMGISWRPYLLWRRLNCAVSAITKGLSATEAAHQAGFSDSAHLSRTFRNLFGMSIRQALALFKADNHK